MTTRRVHHRSNNHCQDIEVITKKYHDGDYGPEIEDTIFTLLNEVLTLRKELKLKS